MLGGRGDECCEKIKNLRSVPGLLASIVYINRNIQLAVLRFLIMDNGSGLEALLGEALMVCGLKYNGFTILFCPQRKLDFSSAAQPCGGCGIIDQKTRFGKNAHAE